MNTRRIVASACALCLASPAAAVASTGADATKAQGPYGLSAVPGPPLTAKAKGPYGLTPVTGPRLTAKAKGPYGLTPVTGPRLTAKAKGPYGLAVVGGPPLAAAGRAPASAAAGSDATTSWRVVAISEAVLLVAFAFGSAGIVSGRHRATAW
jgi:hypothetical protein